MMQLAEPIPVTPMLSMMPERSARQTVKQVDPTIEPGWDDLISSHPDATFFHGAAWARVLKAAYGFTPKYFILSAESRTGVPPVANHQSRTGVPPVAIPGGRDGLPHSDATPFPQSWQHIHAILPLMEARSWLRGTRGVSLPFTDECAPLWSTDADAKLLLETVLHHGREHAWKFWELRGDLGRATLPHGRATLPRSPDQSAVSLQHDFRPTTVLGRRDACPTSASHWKHVLNLSADTESLFDRFDPAVRRAIRKSEKAGLQIEITRDPEAMRQFYRLHCMTRGRHGVPPQPFSFFEAIQKHVMDAGHGFIVLASDTNPFPRNLNPNLNPNLHTSSANGPRNVIAASVYFHLGRRAIYKFGASDMRWQQLRANNLVMWSAIQHLARAGFTTLDMGRTDLQNEGLRTFKQGWGTVESRLVYHRYDFGSESFVDGSSQSAFSAFRFQLSVLKGLRWLPGRAARLLGAVLYPHWE